MISSLDLKWLFAPTSFEKTRNTTVFFSEILLQVKKKLFAIGIAFTLSFQLFLRGV